MSDLARPLAEAAERLFGQRCGAADAAPGAPWAQALWTDVEALAAHQLLVPEAAGGAGGDWLDACALLERAGAFSVPLPLAEALLAGWLRAQAGLGAATPEPVAVAFTAADPAALRGGATLTLDEPGVPWAAQARHVALVGGVADADACLLWLPRDALEVQPAAARGVEPAARVSARALTLRTPGFACARLPGLRVADVRARAAVLTAAEIAGALGRVLALTLAYTGERVQFGRAIGQFQAVQHQLAQLAEEAAAARVAVRAAAKAEGTPWFVPAAAAAKLRAGEAAGLAVRIAHQLHGAIGITAEHALHLSTLRLQAWRDEHGAEAAWARALVDNLRQRGLRSAWQAVVDCTSPG
ncbi:MAG: acyl-CoA dehydrogenase [Rubrivivax sp.]|nr:acyl-CoA dehydrogenase [Burkholderiales bacterium]MCW5637033.1 acyl-CoA dehydrogenase [Rubrivivax sp.]